MQKMSIFSKDQCVRMLESLSESSEENDSKSLRSELFEKFFVQLEKHSASLNSYNVCSALACLEKQSKQDHIQSSAPEMKAMQKRATFLVEKLTDMLMKGQDVAALDLYWGNKFAKTISNALKD